MHETDYLKIGGIEVGDGRDRSPWGNHRHNGPVQDRDNESYMQYGRLDIPHRAHSPCVNENGRG